MDRLLTGMSAKAVNGVLALSRHEPNAREITIMPEGNGKFSVLIQRKKLSLLQEFIIGLARGL